MLQVKITTPYEEKIMNVNITQEGLGIADPNRNGYYKLKQIGKVQLIQLLGNKSDLEKWNTESPDDADIFCAKTPNDKNCILRLMGGATSQALCEILGTK